MPLVDARRALLDRLFDHAPMFPPAAMALPDALAEDARAQASEDAWILGRFVGARIPPVEELADFVRRCRGGGILFKATAGLHHAYPTGGEHGFLNLLASAVFGDEEDALRAERGTFSLDSDSFRWNGLAAGGEELAQVRATLVHSIGSCSFFEPVGELHGLGIL